MAHIIKPIQLKHESSGTTPGAEKMNILEPDVRYVLHSDEFYKFVIVGRTCWMKGYNSIKDIVKQFGMNWKKNPQLKYIGIKK
jgi:hypothetical protein